MTDLPASPGHGPASGAQPLDPHGELRQAVSDCVHCGFCLPSCPTYQLWGEEMDSPRGRIHLIGQLLDGAVASEPAAVHIDRCLGCMACLTSCPSGVRFDRLIAAARSWRSAPAHSPAQSLRPGPPIPAAPPTSQNRPSPDAKRSPAAPRNPVPARSLRERLVREAIFATFPYARRLRLLTGPLRAAQRAGLVRLLDRPGLPGRLVPELGAALRVAPRPAGISPAGRSSPGRSLTGRSLAGRGGGAAAGRAVARLPERVAARGSRRAVVGMLTGCVQQVFFPHVNTATARVLAAEGCDVIVPADQGCCGALSMHDGRTAQAAGFARALIATFEQAGVDAIVVNSAGCGSAMKEYEELLSADPQWAERAAALSAKVADLSEFLARLGPMAPRHPLELKVAYHDACHLAHAQRITEAPRSLLRGIPGLTVTELADAGTCCGSAGIYNLVQPRAASELGARKADAVSQSGADLLVSGNPGCTLQIASALASRQAPMPVAHLAEVLDASIRAVPPAHLLRPT